jgi:2,3-dihydroxybenzoate-AMP ligase
MALNIEGAHAWPEDLANYYREKKWWLGLTWGDILDRNADMYGSRTALIDDNVSLTWEQFRDKADRLAWALLELGVKKNDTVVVQVMNSHEYMVCDRAAGADQPW